MPYTVYLGLNYDNFYFKNYSYNGEMFHNHADSKHCHSFTTLANVEGSPLAVGCHTGGTFTSKAETYDISTNTWTEIADYPYHEK